MQTKLTELVRELKSEKCPQRVHDEVRGRLSARQSSSPRLRLAISMALAALVLLCSLFVWRQQARERTRQRARLAQLTLERTQVARQAENALGLVGSMLLSAGNDSGQIISDRTVPPLRNSFETAKTKINQYINL